MEWDNADIEILKEEELSVLSEILRDKNEQRRLIREYMPIVYNRNRERFSQSAGVLDVIRNFWGRKKNF